MPCVISDREVAFDAGNTPRPTGGALGHVTATPTLVPLWVTTSPGEDEEDQSAGGSGARVAPIDVTTGAWSLTLPWPSTCTPSTVRFTIRRANGALFSGAVPEGIAGPLTVWDLVQHYGWGLAASGATPAPVTAIVGPQRGVPSAYNVLDYGAKGDGAADDTAAINAAIVAANAAGGGIVYLPPGLYRLVPTAFPAYGGRPLDHSRNVCVVLRSRVVLRGAGVGATTLRLTDDVVRPAGATAPSFIHIVANVQMPGASASGLPLDERMAVEDLTVDGHASHATNQQSATDHGCNIWTDGLIVGYARSVDISRVRVQDAFGDGTGPNTPTGYWETFGFEFQNGADCTYTDCEAVCTSGALQTATGFSCDDATNVAYAGCTARNMTVANGFASFGCALVRYANCHAYLCGAAGFSMDRFEDVRYTNCVAGGRADAGGAGGLFAAQQSLGNGGSGFVAGSTGGTSRVYELSGCSARYNRANGLLVAGANVSSVRVVGGFYEFNGYQADGVTIVGLPVGVGINNASSQAPLVSRETQTHGNVSFATHGLSQTNDGLQQPVNIQPKISASATFADLNVGDGGFGTGVAPQFVGDPAGTAIGVNTTTTPGAFLDCQINGVRTLALGPFSTAIGAATTTSAPGAGGADALPGAPAGWATVTINGVARSIPYW